MKKKLITRIILLIVLLAAIGASNFPLHKLRVFKEETFSKP